MQTRIEDDMRQMHSTDEERLPAATPPPPVRPPQPHIYEEPSVKPITHAELIALRRRRFAVAA